MKNNKILITGATGFVGSYIADKFFEKFNSKHITIIGRNIKSWHSTSINNNLICIDLLKDDLTKLGNFDCVIHCAGLHGDNTKSWEDYYNYNALITKRLIEVINFSKLIYISTCSVFSNVKLLKNIPDPSNSYGLSKFIAEKLLKFYSNKNKKSKIIVLRFPTIIGNNSKINLVDYIYNQSLLNQDIEIFGNSHLKRNFIYINLVLNTILKLFYKKKFDSNYEVFNIASSRSMSIKDITKLVKNKTFSKSKIKIILKEPTYNFDTKIDISKSLKSNILSPITTKLNIINFLNDKTN